MSLSAKRLGLIVLSALFFTLSCKQKEKIGLDSGQTIGVDYTDTFSISTKAYLKNDSINISKGNYLFTGAYSDPEFGDIAAEAYTQLLQATENTDVSAFIAVDSVVTTLYYDYQYGDTTQSQTINIYELNEDLSTSENYFTSHAAPATTGGILDNDAAFTLQPSTGKQKIYLSNTFGSDILTQINSGMSNSAFVSAFKGIALVPKNNNEGAVVRFSLFNSTKDSISKVTIYYRTPLDTIAFDLLMNTNAARFTRLVADRSSTPALSALVNNGDEVDLAGKVYLQSGLGVQTKIFFPGLDNLKDSIGTAAINRAELLIETDPSITPDQLTEIGALELVRLDANGNVQQILTPTGLINHVVQKEYQDINGYLYPQEVGYSTTSNSYSFNISTYIHAIMIGNLENTGLLIVSDPIVSSTSVNRAIGGQGVASVKLKLYCTPVE